MLRLFAILFALTLSASLSAQDPNSPDVSTDSVDGTGIQSVDGTGTRSVDGTGIQSVDGTGTRSVDGTGTESVDGTGIQSADGTGARSVDGTGTESVDGTGIQSVDGTGIQSVDGTGLQSADGTAASEYTIQAGDTLGSIAQRFYGDSDLWQQIADANSSVITDPDNIPTGVTITIPGS